ncbi:hypothetical protein A6302_04188 [Methylobrevis pamukkalensis]|uniref:Uncharacterized protein n=2 Tax=Methylobrevis pamukkalensis TaxID=1439726 RepID=A0A1E3GYV7_9HYPH|nr:hypothetical protein [Methylobrevis pamukkalensis]ODN68511.1 hypothetical protein A6302_04188 [Methylobrevis pamukkalensis]
MDDQRSVFDARDRLILALSALLRAERETRAALEAALEDEGISREVLQAMLSDPVPAVTQEDIAHAEHHAAAFARPRRLS